MKLIARPRCIGCPREIDEETMVLRLPPDIGNRMTAVVTPCGDGEARAFYGTTFRVSRLVRLSVLMEEERAAAAAEGRAPRLRALVPDVSPERTWDVADIVEPHDAGPDRALAALMSRVS